MIRTCMSSYNVLCFLSDDVRIQDRDASRCKKQTSYDQELPQPRRHEENEHEAHDAGDCKDAEGEEMSVRPHLIVAESPQAADADHVVRLDVLEDGA